MFAQLKEVEARYQELEQMLSDPAVFGKPGVYQKYAKEHSDLGALVETYREYEKTARRIDEDQALLRESDEELRETRQGGTAPVEGGPGSPGEPAQASFSYPTTRTMRRTSCSRSGPAPGGMKQPSSPRISSGCMRVLRKTPAGRWR